MIRETYIRNRGRPNRTLDEVIQKDMLVKGLSEGKNRDIAIWRRVIHVADPTLSGIRFTLMMMMMILFEVDIMCFEKKMFLLIKKCFKNIRKKF